MVFESEIDRAQVDGTFSSGEDVRKGSIEQTGILSRNGTSKHDNHMENEKNGIEDPFKGYSRNTGKEENPIEDKMISNEGKGQLGIRIGLFLCPENRNNSSLEILHNLSALNCICKSMIY